MEFLIDLENDDSYVEVKVVAGGLEFGAGFTGNNRREIVTRMSAREARALAGSLEAFAAVVERDMAGNE